MTEIDVIKRHFSDENFVLEKQEVYRDLDKEAIEKDIKRLIYWMIPASAFYFFIMGSLLVVMFSAL